MKIFKEDQIIKIFQVEIFTIIEDISKILVKHQAISIQIVNNNKYYILIENFNHIQNRKK